MPADVGSRLIIGPSFVGAGADGAVPEEGGAREHVSEDGSSVKGLFVQVAPLTRTIYFFSPRLRP